MCINRRRRCCSAPINWIKAGLQAHIDSTSLYLSLSLEIQEKDLCLFERELRERDGSWIGRAFISSRAGSSAICSHWPRSKSWFVAPRPNSRRERRLSTGQTLFLSLIFTATDVSFQNSVRLCLNSMQNFQFWLKIAALVHWFWVYCLFHPCNSFNYRIRWSSMKKFLLFNSFYSIIRITFFWLDRRLHVLNSFSWVV